MVVSVDVMLVLLVILYTFCYFYLSLCSFCGNCLSLLLLVFTASVLNKGVKGIVLVFLQQTLYIFK